MIATIIGFFGNIKNAFLAGFALFGGIYIAIQKYKAYQAEDKLKTIEAKIAKTNVVIAKEKAKAKANAKKIETDTEVEVLRELKKESKKVQKEMEVIEKAITKGAEIKTKVKGRTRGKKIKIEV